MATVEAGQPDLKHLTGSACYPEAMTPLTAPLPIFETAAVVLVASLLLTLGWLVHLFR